MDSCPAWNGTKNFERLIEQWDNGGAQRFVYDALNHPFAQINDRQTLVINTNLNTAAGVRQMAQSRSALEKCIVRFMLSGDFRSAKNDYDYQFEGSSNASKNMRWKLDEPLDIQSQALEQSVTSWLRDFDSMAAKHETSLHAIVNTLQKYVGDIEASRPKGLRDGTTGKRPQLATVRHLPPRRKAIEHAWENGLITDEEYVGAIPEPKKSKGFDFWMGGDGDTKGDGEDRGEHTEEKKKYFADLDEHFDDLHLEAWSASTRSGGI